MQTEREQMTEADRATAMLVQGDAEQKLRVIEMLSALANLGHTEAVWAAGALLQLLPGDRHPQIPAWDVQFPPPCAGFRLSGRMKGDITLDVNHPGKQSEGNPYAHFDLRAENVIQLSDKSIGASVHDLNEVGVDKAMRRTLAKLQ